MISKSDEKIRADLIELNWKFFRTGIPIEHIIEGNPEIMQVFSKAEERIYELNEIIDELRKRGN